MQRTSRWYEMRGLSVSIIVDMLLAGTRTSSIGLEWLMAELIKHPKVMKKAQEKKQLRALNLEANHIPANAKVFINAWVIQRDASLWEIPEEFIPERFENSSVGFKGQDFQWFRKGVGMIEMYGLAAYKKVRLRLVPIPYSPYLSMVG
ncbi:hypothetical protein FNV43_RR21466 [Rhamnella rubrinervis]|uniref:Cytochrome P450 n=1 Tax=Rhamnella rubrinervis TaxID=2594499 RepID=A0A8K0GRG6_9ROSA|nr:hypothetical protein FNV43_RR21466 [Rhamnella rubrinervis]